MPRRRTAASSRLRPAHGHQPIDPAARARRASVAEAVATTRCQARGPPGRARAAGAAGAGAPGAAAAAAPRVRRRRRPGRRTAGRPRRTAAAARSRQLGRAVHHQPALVDDGSTGRPTTSIAPTTAATAGRASAPISRATSIATSCRSWASSGRPTRSRATRRRPPLSNIVSIDESPLLEGPALRRHRRRAGAGDGGWRQELAEDRAVPRRAAVDLRHRRLRLAARRRHRVRDAQQLAARRLQALHRQEHRPRADVDQHHAATCPRSTTCGRSSRIT